MTQQLTVLAVLTGYVPSTYATAHNCLSFHLQKIQCPLLNSTRTKQECGIFTTKHTDT